MAGPPVVEEPVTNTVPAPRRRPAWALPVVLIAVLVVAAALVVGVLGLLANPVRSINADGTTTLSGTFEPYQCSGAACDGYVQAGARSVFVRFPNNCPPPARGTTVTLSARPAPDLGSGSYRATGCV
jgi:hypothetical protein